MQHSGVWPWGRANHYLFDLNRDWFILTQPETKGRVETILKWNPQIVIDAHEMGSDDSYLFSPPTDPINKNTPSQILKWYEVFAKDQAAAFDQRGWTYYVGEWHDQWFPGYNSSWPTFFGATAILYEQAGVDGEFVKQSDDYLLSYHEALNKQFTSSFVNIKTLADNREAVLRDYRAMREKIVADGRSSKLTFLFAPEDDEVKTKRFIDRLIMQGIDVQIAEASFKVSSVKDVFGNAHKSRSFPVGTYVISTAQPNGILAKTILEFDPHLPHKFLEEDRREIEKNGYSNMYEVSTWSIPLAYDMEAFTTNSSFTAKLKTISEVTLSSGQLVNPNPSVGYLVNMEGEKTYQMMRELFGQNLVIRGADKDFNCEGRSYNAGTIFIRKRGNVSGLDEILAPFAEVVGIDIIGVNTSMTKSDNYLGGGTFTLLRKPTLAMVAGDGVSYTSFGSLWYAVDKELEFPHSLISLSNLSGTDLSQYNVIILPSSWGPMGQKLGAGGKSNLSDWVDNGGTLICIGSAAVWAADSSSGMSSVVLRRQVLDKLGEYAKSVERERSAESPKLDTMAIYHPSSKTKTDEKEENGNAIKVEKDHDEWLRRFSPAGVMLRVDLDKEEWLTFGMNEKMPVMASGSHAFLSKSPVATVARYADEMDLRVSGLLWPEARERVANSSYLMRERKGSGQLILIANDPNQRAYFHGTRKFVMNAILFGPGFGSSFEGPYNREERH